ncbi:hypothetical protein GTR02_11875, partial [Kineococcus sp. R8]|uniref:hypothetical protein n=1 Tax=Kineococcus siccus TaxID=2696567 RepID=UPI001412EDDF
MNDGDGPDLPECPDLPEGPDLFKGPRGTDRGHLRDGHLRDVRAGHLRDGHLRDGHLRDGHLRDALLPDAGLPTVPDLLATDALLDRLGRHEATDGDLRDAVSLLLDRYALHADPETAGVRGLELPRVEDLPGEPPATATSPDAPRVLLARRRTVERLGRGTAAACAVLALFGGTAAVAATGGADVTGSAAAEPIAGGDGAPGFRLGGTFTSWLTGTPEDRAESALRRLTEQATEGDPEKAAAAAAAARRLAGDLRASGASVQLAAQADAFATTVQQAIERGADVAQALDGPVRPPGVTVDPALVSPTSSTLPGVISQGLRQTAGPDGPYAPTSPTASPGTSGAATPTPG